MRQLLYLDNLFCYNLKFLCINLLSTQYKLQNCFNNKTGLKKVIINSINIKSMKSMKHSDYHGSYFDWRCFFVALFFVWNNGICTKQTG